MRFQGIVSGIDDFKIGKLCREYEGECTWISTDGKSLYLKASMKDSEQPCTIVTDVDGNIKKEYEEHFRRMIPTEEYLYYSFEECEKKNKRHRLEIVRLNQETGEEDRYEVPCVSEEREERTICYFECDFAYADESYVNIIYRKVHGTTSGSVSQDYVARIYSSKTGEELQIEELFDVDWEKVVERMTFLIRKTERSYDLFNEYEYSFESNYRRRYYCLNDFGIDILFVEDMRTFKEYHFVISYDELISAEINFILYR